MIKKYEELPQEMKNEYVKKYYDILQKKKYSLYAKRLFDIVCSLLLLFISFPILILLGILIKLDSKGPVLYRQERVTTYGKTFKILKLRTMVQNADKIGGLLTEESDLRITNIGYLLRKFRLDELPQLINILKGEMSFVGPRPEVKKHVEKFTDEMKAALLIPAGVTSMASIKYKDENKIFKEKVKAGKDIETVYIEEILPDKMKCNLEYITRISLLYDLKICINTVISVLK